MRSLTIAAPAARCWYLVAKLCSGSFVALVSISVATACAMPTHRSLTLSNASANLLSRAR